jgi:hypothetical protein
MSTIRTLQTISTVAALISALCLYYGSLGVPFEIQSYKGQSAGELAIKRRDKILKWIGIPSAVVAGLTQIWSIWI